MRLLQVLLYGVSGTLAVLLAGLAGLRLARYRRRPKFRRGPLQPLERTLLEALKERCDPAVQERLAKQIPLLRTHCRRVFPIAEVRSVPLGEHNYYCLAHDGVIMLCVREGARSAQLYTCAIADDAVLPTDASFRAMIEGSATL